LRISIGGTLDAADVELNQIARRDPLDILSHQRGSFAMHNKFPNLFSPLKVGMHTYKNRVIGSPIYCGPFVSIPFLSDVTAKAVTERAKGGCAQVTVGETAVDFEYANKDPFPPIDFTNYDDPAFAKLGALAKSIKDNGAVAMIELNHVGAARLPLPMFKGALGPNEETNEFGMKVTGMDKAMIDDVIEKHIVAAKFMRAAGYDGVMVHCGHGWLLAQFLSARTNHRTDEYGGSLENRARFSVELIKALREAMGKEFLIEVRVSGDERTEGGQGVDEIAAFCKMIEPYIDSIHVSVGIYRQPVLSGMFNSLFEPHALNAEMAAVIKKAVKIPVTVVGGINSPELAEQIIAEGKCDFIALGRQLTADPDFAVKAETGREDDIVRCLRCFKCLPGQLEEVMDDLSKLFGCTVNPEAYLFDRKILDSKPAASRNVVIIGGGIAGMEAAVVAADRGHKVTIYEKNNYLGGLLRFTDWDSYKGDLREFKDLMVRRVGKRANIKVMMNKEVTPAELAAMKPDVLVLATGSTPIDPPIEGLSCAMRALDAYEHIDKIGKKVIVVGGGLVGSEAGLHLAKNGRDVEILEMLDKVAPDSYPLHREALVHEMDAKLKYRTGMKVTSIARNGVKAVNKEGNEEFIGCDTVVYALGMRANRKETEELHKAAVGNNIMVHEIGDCVRAAKVYEGITEGYLAAMSIL
jgi:2,4-dienoyl-CoA reductase-like NADH-dependent reductase (Old Yellow Enzyme family)/NADPH-dependent 2,4-dienoyl-CoA reductase/sulfur reductase-like enzyme